MTYGLQIRGSTTELYRLSSKTAVGKPYSVTVLCARQFPRDTHLIFAENSATKTLLSGISGLEPETWILKVSLLYQLSYIPHNRPLTVSTRIYRAMRDTIRFVLPLLLSGLGGLFAFFSICQKYREKLAWNTMFQAVWIAYKTALFHIYQTLLLRFFY